MPSCNNNNVNNNNKQEREKQIKRIWCPVLQTGNIAWSLNVTVQRVILAQIF